MLDYSLKVNILLWHSDGAHATDGIVFNRNRHYFCDMKSVYEMPKRKEKKREIITSQN